MRVCVPILPRTRPVQVMADSCRLKLLQSTITGACTMSWLYSPCILTPVIGVVLLHLLLVPGTAFLAGGARIWEQQLHPHRSQLNLTLLTVGFVPPL